MRARERRRRRRAVAALDFEDQVGAELLVQHRRIRIEAARDVGDRRQGFVIDRDRLGAVDRRVAVVRDDGGHHVAHVVDLARGERRAQHLVHRPSVRERHRMDAGERAQPRRRPVLGGEHPEHARQRPGGARVDAPDPGMRVGRANEGDMRGAGGLDIVDEPPAPLEKLVVPRGASASDRHTFPPSGPPLSRINNGRGRTGCQAGLGAGGGVALSCAGAGKEP